MPIISLRKIKPPRKNSLITWLAVLLGGATLLTMLSYHGFTLKTAAGVLIFIGSVFLLVYFFLRTFHPRVLSEPVKILAVESVVLMMLLIGILIENTPGIPSYFLPAGGAGILLTVLISPVMAGIGIFVTAIFAGTLGGLSLSSFYVAAAGGMAAVFSSLNVRNRNDLNKSGLYILTANIMTVSALDMIGGQSLVPVGVNVAWGAGNALISVVIASGLLPIMENLFGITTNIRLLELGDFNQPLLKRLMLEAPGSYHHSLMVGNLAENACERIEANALLARVGAYYHDIGKLKNPQYFVENQLHMKDSHKNLKPNISALILKRHVKDGLALAEEYKIDRVVRDMVAEHHGKTLIEYFYKKVTEEDLGEDVLDEKEYRYPGPRPKSKESGVLMLADSAEAACRALAEPTYSRISAVVTKVINNKFIDGQLNNCDLTLASLEVIQESFINTLAAIYHSRIEYPEDKEENS